MVTMLLGGLWHGANWTFVVWGGLHGFYLWVEKFVQDKLSRNKARVEQDVAVVGITSSNTSLAFIYALFTFFLINVTWVFFRATTFTQAWTLLSSMFGMSGDVEPAFTTLAIIKVSVIISLMVIAHWLMRKSSVLQLALKIPWWFLAIVWALMLMALALSQESSSSFIYFQF